MARVGPQRHRDWEWGEGIVVVRIFNDTTNYNDSIFFTNLVHKFFIFYKFIIFLYMFRALLCSSSGGQLY